jgi:uncharacterized membrane protein YheB (UPF0754 family)
VLNFDASLLTALAHPGIGAFIGYLTNKVAIRMLFRPLEPWYFFGLRVPMTPGVIPSKRHDLAENIGEMVGRHLLTSKDIGAAVSEEPFQEHLANLVDRRVREILMRDLGPIDEVIPRKFRAYFKVGVKTLKYQLNAGVNQYLAGDRFAEQLTASISSRLDSLAEQEVNGLLAPENRRDVYLFIGDVIRDLLGGEGAALWLGDALAAGLRKSAAEGKQLGDLVPEKMVELFKGFVREHADQILAGMGRQIADPLIRAQVVSGVLGGVDHFLDSLGPMGAMARGFLERDTLEQKIDEYLREKEGDLVTWLGRPEIRSRMVVGLEQAIDDFLHKPLAELLAGMQDEECTVLCRDAATHLLGILQAEGALNGISALVHIGLEDLLDGGQRTFADLGRQWFPEERGERFREVLNRECVDLFRSGKTERLVNTMLASMVDALVNRPIGMLYNIVPHGIRRAFNTTIIHMINRMLLQEVPGMVESLNIKRLVTEKVDGLDLLQLERLLLSIMEEQFKYINLFGAFLGFLIGLINLALVEFL